MEDSVIEEIARVRARLDNGEPRDDVLRDADKTSDVWESDEQALLALLSDDVETGRTDRVLRFQKAYAELRGAEPAPVARSSSDAPSPVGLDSTAPGVPGSPSATVDETVIVAGAPQPALPFEAPSASAPPKLVSIAALMRGDPGSTGTRELDPDEVLPRSVPFGRTAQTPLMTGEIDRAQLGLPAVPFSGSNPAPAPRSASDPVVQSDLTLLAGDTHVDAPAIPFVADDALISLEKYAEITSILTNEGDPTKTFIRLGINPAAWLSTVRTYSKRFANDPDLEAQFNDLLKKNKTHAR